MSDPRDTGDPPPPCTERPVAVGVAVVGCLFLVATFVLSVVVVLSVAEVRTRVRGLEANVSLGWHELRATQVMTADAELKLAVDGDRIDGMANTLDGMQTGLPDVDHRVDRLNGTVQGLHETVRGLHETVRGLHETVQGLHETVRGLRGGMEQTRRAVDNVTRTVDNTTRAVRKLEAQGGEMRLFPNRTACPPGWTEPRALRGYVLVSRPAGGVSGQRRGGPPLTPREMGRVGSHDHEAVVHETGHTHAVGKHTLGVQRQGVTRYYPQVQDSSSADPLRTDPGFSNVTVQIRNNSGGAHYPLLHVLVCVRP